MIATLTINRLAKTVSSQDYRDGLKNLKELVKQANAEDKKGAFTAIAEILTLSIIISCCVYALTLQIFPNNFLKFYRNKDAEYNERYNTKSNSKSKKGGSLDFMDLLDQIINWLPKAVGCYGGYRGYMYYKRKKDKAGRQRMMEQAMKEEMDRLREQLAQEIDESSSAGGVTDNKPGLLSGNIVELFNTFASIMEIQKDLPREKDETAQEYFIKISNSIKFPKDDALKASKYFDDELYGKKESTTEDRNAFMKLLLEMMNKVNIGSLKKSLA